MFKYKSLICSDNPQKAIIQKQKYSKMITITQHNALVLPIFIRLSTDAITHINWYYIVESLNRTKNSSANIDIQQLEKTPTINLNGDNLDGSLANQTIDNNDLLHRADNTTVNLEAAFYTNNKLGEFLVYSYLSLWPSSTRAEIVAIYLGIGHSDITGNDIADKLAKKGQYENNLFRNNVGFINNILSYFPVFIDKSIEVNIRRFILKILVTGEATEWSLLKNNQELCYEDVNQIDWKITWL
ncbi:hypothetical protein RhiirA5_416212 [Rhizophagus irregularis]|uniref:RNase H type-1 domain-containing protein n=1 Tax=Rhizophagus irregularis TaxID=588596 RepID=A0A2N0PQ97_9GLOM|nr:hypothetical protein RhiirA5_416212 [Rhizophagus irregularis]